MKIMTALFILGLMMSPVVGLAQTANNQVPPSANVVSPSTTAVSSAPIKCGVNTFVVNNDCGIGAFKSAYVQCYDGYEITLGDATACKSSENWQQYAKEVCVNRCSAGKEPSVTPKPLPLPVSIPVSTLAPTSKPLSICYISDKLMREYNQLIVELQKAEPNKTLVEEVTNKIIALKREIEKQQKECVSPPRSVPLIPPTAIENKPVVAPIDRCNEVTQWENKIAYYKKLSGSSEADLKKGGFSREEIDKILRELSLGLEKVKAQCSNQKGTIIVPPTVTTGSPSVTESIKPVVVESGQEISDYYKIKLEKAASAKGEEKQIEELKILRNEIDGLISKFIKSRKELEISEINTLVQEVKVSRGEIKADNISVKTTDKKMLINIGNRPVSIEPTASQVLIRDKDLEVKIDEAVIKGNKLSVGGAEVKMSASEVAEKLGLAPKAVELKEENTKAVYNMKIGERRKLFGLIPFNIQKTVAADAGDGSILRERLPWYNFLTTKYK